MWKTAEVSTLSNAEYEGIVQKLSHRISSVEEFRCKPANRTIRREGEGGNLTGKCCG